MHIAQETLRRCSLDGQKRDKMPLQPSGLRPETSRGTIGELPQELSRVTL